MPSNPKDIKGLRQTEKFALFLHFKSNSSSFTGNFPGMNFARMQLFRRNKSPVFGKRYPKPIFNDPGFQINWTRTKLSGYN